jgi:GNAT superfamily N-acetyltransferase
MAMAAWVEGWGSWRRQIIRTAIGGASRSGRKTTPSRRYCAVVPSGVMPTPPPAAMIVWKGYRGRGLTYALARATIGFARGRGARALEAYPMITQPGKGITWGEVRVGARQVFEDAGFVKVSHPTVRRVVMRIDFPEDQAPAPGGVV